MGLTRYGVKTQDLGNQRSWKIGRNSIHWHSVRVFSIATWKIWNRFRIACARISQEESIEEYRQRKLTIEFTLIVGSTHCYQSLHRFLDLLPPNFAIDFFQHGFELRIGSRVLHSASESNKLDSHDLSQRRPHPPHLQSATASQRPFGQNFDIYTQYIYIYIYI